MTSERAAEENYETGPQVFYLHYKAQLRAEQKTPSISFKTNKTTTARCRDGGIFSNQVGMVGRSSTTSGASAGQLGPPPSLLMELSTTSQMGRWALHRSSIFQVK